MEKPTMKQAMNDVEVFVLYFDQIAGDCRDPHQGQYEIEIAAKAKAAVELLKGAIK